jgi:MFS family permease
MPASGTNDELPSLPADLAPGRRAIPPSVTAPVSPAPAGRLGTFRALRHRNYRLYFTGQMVSLTGSWVQTTALMWLAYRLTGESRWPAFVMALQVFPTCVLGVWGGALAERWPRRAVIMRTQAALMVNALLLAALVLGGHVEPWHLLVVAGVGGLISAIDLPARLSFVVDMVGREDLMNAVALNSLTFNLARALGPALGALLLRTLGPGPCFLINGLSYLGVLTALYRMQVSGSPARPSGRLAGSVREAFRYLAGRPALTLLLVLVAVMAFFGWPVLSLLPGLAQRRLGATEFGYGLLVSGVGGGALLAALTIATFGSLARGRRFVTLGVGVTAVALLGLSLVRSLPLAAACCVLVGYGLILFMSTSQGIVQLSAADHNRGPILGIWSMVLSGSQPLGNLLLGPAADRYGEAAVVRVQALGCALAALGVLFLLLLWARPRGAPAPG